MKDLNYQLRELCRQNRDGGFSTQATRSRILDLLANQLHELGYRHMQSKSLKPKHAEALVAHWREQGISIGTLKNRLAALRWWAAKIHKQNVIARDNTAYGIGSRTYVAEHSRAQTLDETRVGAIADEYVRMSVRLQAAFGLRREEAIKFRPAYAIRDGHITLKASWTKGGRARTVPITNDEQRRLLEEAKALARGGSLIPADKNYVQQLRRYEHQTARAGLMKLHGLRHGYAQRRYQELTGQPCPAQGGAATRDLSPEQRAIDTKARLRISSELGHVREAITAVYLGR
jgi:site-specific recombinase XerC